MTLKTVLGVVIPLLRDMKTEAIMWFISGGIVVYAIWMHSRVKRLSEAVALGFKKLTQDSNRQRELSEFISLQVLGFATDQDKKAAVHEIAKEFMKKAFEPITDVYETEKSIVKKGNPLTENELAELKLYIDMARDGQRFNVSQAKRFDSLAGKLDKEAENNPAFGFGTILLVAIAGFILGALSNRD
jgi:hypothetical protein